MTVEELEQANQAEVVAAIPVERLEAAGDEFHASVGLVNPRQGFMERTQKDAEALDD